MRKRLLSMLLTLSVLCTMMWTSAMAAGTSPIPVEFLPQVLGFNYDADEGTAAIKYSMREYTGAESYRDGYRAILWGNNGNRNSVFSGLLPETENGQSAMDFFDELPAGYTPILSGVVAFMSVDPLYTQETGYGVNVTVEDSLDIPENIEELSGDGPISMEAFGTEHKKEILDALQEQGYRPKLVTASL